MKSAWIAIVVAAVIVSIPICRAAQPERLVLHNTVISRRDPAVEIKLPAFVHYVGTDRFLLSDPKIGNFDACELYAFVDSDQGRHVRKFYWLQFEGYLPAHPDLHFTYDSPRHTTIGGLDFYVDMELSSPTKPPKPGSDGAHFRSLLASNGYQRDDSMAVRLVHLVDTMKRKELMIIYGESLASTGYSAAQLAEGGAEHAKWAAIADGLIRRAEQSIRISSGGSFSSDALLEHMQRDVILQPQPLSVILSAARSRPAGERKSKDPENAGIGNLDSGFLTKRHGRKATNSNKEMKVVGVLRLAALAHDDKLQSGIE